MSHNFKPYGQDPMYLMPPSLSEWVVEGSLPRFVSEVVDGLDSAGKRASF